MDAVVCGVKKAIVDFWGGGVNPQPSTRVGKNNSIWVLGLARAVVGCCVVCCLRVWGGGAGNCALKLGPKLGRLLSVRRKRSQTFKSGCLLQTDV